MSYKTSLTHIVRIVIVPAIAFSILCNVAQSIQAQSSASTVQTGIKFSITNTDIAYPVSGEKNISLTITNYLTENHRFTLADDYVQSIVLTLFNKSGIPIPMQPDIIRRRNEPVAYRSFILNPQETFTFTVNLEDYFIISGPGIYKIQARYYPQFYTDNKKYISSNILLIPINNFEKNDTADMNNNNTSNNLYATLEEFRSYPPDVVIKNMLEAMQKTDWDRFFTFMDIRKLYINTTISSNIFGTFNSEKQAQVLINFKNKIINNDSSAIDLFSPDYFSIENTYYTRTNARVTVFAYTLINTMVNVKQYTFFLQKINAMWKVTDFNSRIIKTVPKSKIPYTQDTKIPSKLQSKRHNATVLKKSKIPTKEVYLTPNTLMNMQQNNNNLTR